MEQKRRKVRSFVLRGGRLSTTQQRALEELAPLYDLSRTAAGSLDFSRVFPRVQPVVVEVGFGKGEVTVQLAEQFPQYNFLGIEVHKPGVGQVLHEIHQRGLSNLRVYRGDAVEVLEQLIPPESVHGFHIFFPDPWPKKKHHKRRLLQPPFAALLIRALQAGGYVYAVTDWQEYAEQILEVLSGMEGLNNPCRGFSPPISWRPQTSFERKGLEQQHPIWEVWVEKKN
jgi:tRNA (guanine-N7-)-methyltransferase